MPTELKFPVRGDPALACYFVKANWPKGGVEPRLQTIGPDMMLLVEFEAHSIRLLQEMLQKAGLVDRRMARGARCVKMMLAAQLVGRIIPDAGHYRRGVVVEAG